MSNNKLLPYFPEINYIKKHLLELADEVASKSPAAADKFRAIANDLDDVQHKVVEDGPSNSSTSPAPSPSQTESPT